MLNDEARSIARRVALICALLFVTMLAGCPSSCPRSTAQPQGSAALALGVYIPQSAQSVLFAERLDALVEAMAASAGQLPVETKLGLMRETWTAQLDHDPLDVASWHALGLWLDRPAVLFYTEGRWVLAAAVRDASALNTALSARAQSGDVAIVRGKNSGFRTLRLESGSAPAVPIVHVAHGRDTAIFVIERGLWSTGWQTEAADLVRGERLLLELLEITPERRWQGLARHGELIKSTAAGAAPFHGAVEPGPWLLQMRSGGGHARLLLERLAHQMGRVHFVARHEPDARKLQLHLRTYGNPGEPVVVADLGQPKGEMPMVGGLIKPGVLGVVRVSGAPEQFFELVRSALPATQRAELDQMFRDMAAELKIDVKKDLVDNLKGHVIVVLYGIENRVLTPDNPRLVADIFQLKATREAVLLPIHERAAMERTLDVMTQLSRGNLRRQAIRDSIQYAWLPDGALEWALILNDDYLIFVDSAVAVDHAIAYERSPHPRGPAVSELGIEALFENTNRSGFYLDVGSAANILAESGQQEAGRWLQAFQSVLLTTDDIDSIGYTDIELVLSPARSATGE
ncbi:MAG: hypothetical protein H0U74_21155 [Bradymonadaceae bacterium]|nr:hypothetical protein [Lujinxingiaceae bacterium]